jgi:hypothetical protein
VTLDLYAGPDGKLYEVPPPMQQHLQHQQQQQLQPQRSRQQLVGQAETPVTRSPIASGNYGAPGTPLQHQQQRRAELVAQLPHPTIAEVDSVAEASDSRATSISGAGKKQHSL